MLYALTSEGNKIRDKKVIFPWITWSVTAFGKIDGREKFNHLLSMR